MRTLAILRIVAKAAGREGGVRNLVPLHHTDCGIIECYHHAPDLLAEHLGIDTAALDELEITDPYNSIVHDIAALQAGDELPDGVMVSGLVYDVRTGLVEMFVAPAPL